MQYLDVMGRRLSSEPLLRMVGLIGLVFASAIAAPLLLFHNSGSAFLPHLFCYLSNPALTWTHVSSDSIIGVSYLCISLTLLYIVHRSRATVPFSWLVLAFGLFIVACGATHVMEVITIWKPLYWVSASIKVLTAGASLATAIALPLVTPLILHRLEAAGSSEDRRVQLEAANLELGRLNRELKELDSLRDSLMAQQAARVGDWEWNIKTGENRWSTAVEMMHGFAPGSYNGRYESWINTVHPEDRDRVLGTITEAFRSGQYEVEYRTLRPDGSTYWTAARGMVLYDAAGKPHRMLGISMDATARKRAEEGLVRAEKLAAAGRLAATVAHEINNPLEAVTNLVYLARTTDSDPKPLLELADRELSRMAAITRQTLGFYRSMASPTDVDVASVLEEVVQLYSSKLEAKKVCAKVHAPFRPVVRASHGDLHQIFGNLLANAIDASPEDGGILLRIEGAEDSGFVVEIEDAGIGIPPEVGNLVFEPFYTTKKDIGTGLGLWVSRQLIEHMGGRISFHANVHKPGTCFQVHLPPALTGNKVAA